jgi:hypothetical protein
MSTESTIQLPTSDQDTASHCSTARATACRTIHDFIAPSQILACTPSSIKLLIGSDTRLLDPGFSELWLKARSDRGRGTSTTRCTWTDLPRSSEGNRLIR